MKYRILSLILAVFVFCPAVIAADRSAVRADIFKILTELTQPLTTQPEPGKIWLLKVNGEVMGKKGQIEMAWDGQACHALQVKLADLPPVSAGFGTEKSWLALPEKEKVFVAEHPKVEGSSLLTGSKSWEALVTQVPGFLAMAMFVPLPDDLQLDKKEDGTLVIKDGRDLALEITKGPEPGHLKIISTSEKFPGRIEATAWSQVEHGQIDAMLAVPAFTASEQVEVDHLHGMLRTLADFAAENVLQRINKDLVPDPLAGVPRVDGVAVVKVSGTPEEMGIQHGTFLKEAVHYNMHRTLHGVGLVATIETGKWFPNELAMAWKAQEKYIPERFIREIDAMSDAAGIPREWGHSVNVFPELFHCSGLALRGQATVDGHLYHGRVLDYMTGIGLQRTAVVMVFQPRDQNAWVSYSYAGLCSTVTAMNEKGLTMGEMGGRGEGYWDGIPMSLMMREIMERFETTEETLAWMQSVPRTCEYYYVLSDAKTKNMAGIASMAKKLADEKGLPDFKIIEPGMFDERLPHPHPDTVLMSADKRYECLSERVKENYGKLDMQGAWNLMRGGVAMKSNLHTVLFAPETQDFWVAQAGMEGEPAYTQKIHKFNLKQLLNGESPTRTSDAGASK